MLLLNGVILKQIIHIIRVLYLIYLWGNIFLAIYDKFWG